MKSLYTLLLLLTVCFAQAAIRRVKPAATIGSGSWIGTSSNLQTTLNNCVAGDEVWVAAGTYQPTLNTFFSIPGGVKVYGGFNATETVSSARNWKTNVTILKGNGSSVLSSGNSDATTILDGFTVTGGQNSSSGYGGGGITCFDSYIQITNVIFDNNNATLGGGGMYNVYGGPKLTNVLFINNKTPNDGGGIYCDYTDLVLTNVVFEANIATSDGGAMSITGNTAQLSQVIFYKNAASTGAGGALFNNRSTVTIVNSTVVANFSGLSGCAGGFHNYSPSGTSPLPAGNVTNTVFFDNTCVNNSTLADFVNSNAATTLTYSAFNAGISGVGNVTIGTVSPFTDVNSPKGNDNTYMTSDDGFQLSFCNAANLIDKGNDTAASSLLLDIAGLTRKFEVPLITNRGGLTNTVDMGAYENQTATTLASLVGTIGGGHMIPTPRELFPDGFTSGTPPAAGMNIRWQVKNGTTWNNAPGTNSGATYTLPDAAPSAGTYYYRRSVSSSAFCNTVYATDSVLLQVINPLGAIDVSIVSNSNDPVQDDTVQITRLGPAISGSPQFYTYTGVTGPDGHCRFTHIYFGDPGNTPQDVFYKVKPIKYLHGFKDSTATVFIHTGFTNAVASFKDTTVFSVTGRAFQQCADCTTPTGTLSSPLQTCPVDSVDIWRGYPTPTPFTHTGPINDVHGLYALSVSNQGNLSIEPHYKNHKFDPTIKTLNVLNTITGVDFKDTSTHAISGRFTDGCGNYLGQLVLEFIDTAGCFRKRITTELNTGKFNIQLPAKKYKVEIKGFIPNPAFVFGTDPYVFPNDVTTYFADPKIADTLVRDIMLRDTTMNFRFERLPSISIVAGLNTMCGTVDRRFSVFQQGFLDSFIVKVTQGPASLGCIVTDTVAQIHISTSVPSQNDSRQELYYKPLQAGTKVVLLGGAPHVLDSFQKSLDIYYVDRFGRSAVSLRKGVVVTGSKVDGATFTTVSPQVPLLVLHDPPGDNSYSYWTSSHTMQSAMRMYAAKGNSTNAWVQAKIGTKFEAGLGVSTETEIWGTLKGGVTVEASKSTSDETIVTSRTSTTYKTSDNSNIIGAKGDVFVGAAINIIYAKALEISDSGCAIVSHKKLLVSPDSLKTEYVYTEGYITDYLIPSLALNAVYATTDTTRKRFLNQMKVWQQVLDNNTENKARAIFDHNISFSGGSEKGGETSTSLSKSSTVEFTMNINTQVAAELGLEVAGSGVSGGVDLNFKIESGNSNTDETIDETVIGYTLKDDDDGDAFTVNVKKDPVYGTPVFEVMAGTSSCPAEENTELVDQVDISTTTPIKTDIPAYTQTQFVLNLSNTNPGNYMRDYQVGFDQTSNPYGAEIKIGGSPAIGFTTYHMMPYTSVPITVTVTQPTSSNVYSFEGLKFIVKSDCGGDSSHSVSISAFYQTTTSSAVMSGPEDGWVLNTSANNIIPVNITGYDRTRLTSITMEYSKAGTSGWVTGFIKTAAQLNSNAANGTLENYNILTPPFGVPWTDGKYNIRLKIIYGSSILYMERKTILVDRQAPSLFGVPEPTDRNYVTGEKIAFNYDEEMDMSDLNFNRVTITNIRTNAVVPVTVTGYNNRIVIMPTSGFGAPAGDSFRVVVANMYDINGNLKPKPDTSYFVLGSFIPATGNNVVSLSIKNPVVYKNSDSTINVYFTLPVNTGEGGMRVNYTVNGTARFHADYDTAFMYSSRPPLFAVLNGSQGSIYIEPYTRQAVLKIDPISSYLLDSNKTITVNLSEGGDYALGTNNSVTGIISNQDSIATYTFTGDGNFDVKSNWLGGKMPLSTVVAGKTVIIDPSGVCKMNIPVSIKPGATLRVKENKELIIMGKLDIK